MGRDKSQTVQTPQTCLPLSTPPTSLSLSSPLHGFSSCAATYRIITFLSFLTSPLRHFIPFTLKALHLLILQGPSYPSLLIPPPQHRT